MSVCSKWGVVSIYEWMRGSEREVRVMVRQGGRGRAEAAGRGCALGKV